jgi:hypothetical protein
MPTSGAGFAIAWIYALAHLVVVDVAAFHRFHDAGLELAHLSAGRQATSRWPERAGA